MLATGLLQISQAEVQAFRAKMLGGRVWRDIVKARERSARYKAKKRLERKA